MNHIELATDEDRAHSIDRWAMLFKATTWEEIRMIAENSPILTEASETLYTYNADEMARQRSQARAEYLAHERAVNKKLSENAKEIATLTSEKQEWTAEKQAMAADKQTMAAEIERRRTRLAAFENPEVSK